MIQLDKHIFEMGWFNHQLGNICNQKMQRNMQVYMQSKLILHISKLKNYINIFLKSLEITRFKRKTSC